MRPLSLVDLFGSPAEPVPMGGFVHPDFADVADALRAQITGRAGGAALCVYHEGECVADLWGGYRDEAGRPWQRDTMSPSFSTTKGVASTVVHILADRGFLDYDARVADYWPEFGQAGKGRITVRQVLAHQSGLYHIRQMVDRADRMLDWEYMVRAIERAQPIHEPGTRTGYHGLTYGFLVGELVQRLMRRPFPHLVRELVAEPLHLDGMYIGAPADQLDRAAKLIWPQANVFGLLGIGLMRMGGAELGEYIDGPAAGIQRVLDLFGIRFDLPSILDALAPRGIAAFDFNAAETLQASIPAANGLFTARSLGRMYAALAADGSIDGMRLLSRRAIARATEVQTPVPGRLVIPFDMRWRLGYHGVFTTRGVPRHAFGHFGFGGSGAWADPSRQLAMAMIVNSGIGTPFGDLRIARIGGAVLAAADVRRPRTRLASLPSVAPVHPALSEAGAGGGMRPVPTAPASAA